jgi:hypothetical protein
VDIEPAATLRCWAVDVDLTPTVAVTIPALPARPWLVAVVTGGWPAIIPGLLDPVPEVVDEGILDGTIPARARVRAAKAALATVAGCPWWTAQRLAHACAGTAIGSELALRGVDPGVMPFAAYLAAGYRAATRYLSDVKRAEIDMRLDVPPADAEPEEIYDRGTAAALFVAAAGGNR